MCRPIDLSGPLVSNYLTQQQQLKENGNKISNAIPSKDETMVNMRQMVPIYYHIPNSPMSTPIAYQIIPTFIQQVMKTTNHFYLSNSDYFPSTFTPTTNEIINDKLQHQHVPKEENMIDNNINNTINHTVQDELNDEDIYLFEKNNNDDLLDDEEMSILENFLQNKIDTEHEKEKIDDIDFTNDDSILSLSLLDMPPMEMILSNDESNEDNNSIPFDHVKDILKNEIFLENKNKNVNSKIDLVDPLFYQKKNNVEKNYDPNKNYNSLTSMNHIESLKKDNDIQSNIFLNPNELKGNYGFNFDLKLEENIQKKSRRLCRIKDCNKRSRSMGLCIGHGGGKRCEVLGCSKSSQGGNLCIRHGGGKRCIVANCFKAAQSNYLCKAHGGGPRCLHPSGCNRSSQGGGFCRSHGGGKRCHFTMIDKITGQIIFRCEKGTQRGEFCCLHGGARICGVPTCKRNDRGGGFCATHGGGKRCSITGCNRACRKNGKCSDHCNNDM